MLRGNEMQKVLDSCKVSDSIGMLDIDPVAAVLKSVTQKRHGKSICWRSQNDDSGKKTESHNVCWTNTFVSQPFIKHSDIMDTDDFHFGKITSLLSVTVAETTHHFARVMEYRTAQYKFGGIWVADSSEKRSNLVPLVCLSEPLVTATLSTMPNYIHVLNSKIRFSPTEARTISDHMNTP